MSKVRLALEEKQQDLQLRHDGAFTKPEFKEMR
jgi:hypothetical protein